MQISTFADNVETTKKIIVYNEVAADIPINKFWAHVTKQILSDKNIVEIGFKGIGSVSRQVLDLLIQLNINIPPQLVPEYARKIASLRITHESLRTTNFTPLHFAAIANCDENLRFHLQTIPPDTVDKCGRTALHIASYLGHYEIAKQLLQHGASVRFCSHLFGTAYTQAIQGRQTSIQKLLESHDEKEAPDAISKIAVELFIKKQPRLQNSKRLYQRALFESGKSKLLSKYYKYETALRRLSHSWKIEWDLTSADKPGENQKIFYRDRKETIDFIPLPGGFGPYFLGQMAKATTDFVAQFQDDSTYPLTPFPLLIETLTTGSNQYHLKAQTLHARYLEHKPLILAVEFNSPSHSTSVLIWENYICLCNRGYASRRAVEVFHFHPRKLSPTILIQLLDRIESAQDFTTLLFRTLPQELQMYKNKHTQALEQLLALPPQLIENCSWESQETAVFTFLVLSDILADRSLDLTKVVEKQRFVQCDWLHFQQLYSLEKYLKILSDPKYKFFTSNQPMCQEIYGKFHFLKRNRLAHPILQGKMAELENRYPLLKIFAQSHAIL